MSENIPEKRKHTRHSLHENVRLEVDGQVVVGQTADISQGGVAVVAENNLSNDAFVRMHIDTIGEVSGHVVRAGDTGFAIEFDPVDEERERLAAQLKSMFEKD